MPASGSVTVPTAELFVALTVTVRSVPSSFLTGLVAAASSYTPKTNVPLVALAMVPLDGSIIRFVTFKVGFLSFFSDTFTV